ncbi:lipopolysaccharide biosynthesis protein, partial [Helcococcus bovis]|uniref:lipopolysaccharide biosynthesis protein n=1 Tax=Helcococcus bovis TaxID=3153252 RepID=UPI0038B7D3E4
MNNGKERNNYLIKNTAIFTLGNLGSRFINFLLVPIYTKVLTTHEFGNIDLILAICTVFIPLFTLNIGEAVMRFLLDKKRNTDKIFNNGILITLLSFILFLVIFPISKNSVIFSKISYSIYLYCVSVSIYSFMICYLRGIEKLLEYSLINILNTFFIAIFNILFLVFLNMGIEGYLNAFSLANILSSFICLFMVNFRENLNLNRIDLDLMKHMVNYSLFLIPTTLMWWIMNSSDRIMIGYMIGIKENGIYAISYKIPSILAALSAVFNQAWSYSAIKDKDSEDIEEYSNKMYENLFYTLIILTGGFLVILKTFLRYYVSSGYYSAWLYTPYLLIGFIFLTLATFLSTSYTVNKDSRGFLYSGMIGAIVNIILNYFLI